jgi:malate dehydrogenase
MPVIAIIGAGAIGGALAQKLALRNRVREVRLIDAVHDIAAGKALDIRQSSPIEGFSTVVTAGDFPYGAAGADVVVLADHASGEGEHTGEAGLALVRRLLALGSEAPMVCAGTEQRVLIARAVSELHVAPARVVGSAPVALESALSALAALELDGSGVEVTLRVVGVPPRDAVVAWEEATASGAPLTSALPPHEIAALGARIPGLWPPGPYALGSAGARVVEALSGRSRRRYSCFVWLGRGRVAAMPVELWAAGVRRVLEPSLTRQERTMLENALERSARASGS